MKYFDYITIVSLAIFSVSTLTYFILSLYGHRLQRKLDYKLQDAAMVGMSFIVLAVIAAMIKMVIVLWERY